MSPAGHKSCFDKTDSKLNTDGFKVELNTNLHVSVSSTHNQNIKKMF